MLDSNVYFNGISDYLYMIFYTRKLIGWKLPLFREISTYSEVNLPKNTNEDHNSIFSPLFFPSENRLILFQK